MERYHRLQKMEQEPPVDPSLEPPIDPPMASESGASPVSERERRLYLDLFVGREDTYTEEYMLQRRVVEQKNEPLTDEVIKEHLSGARTIGTYVQRPNSTARYLVIDIDISKKILLRYPAESGDAFLMRTLAW